MRKRFLFLAFFLCAFAAPRMDGSLLAREPVYVPGEQRGLADTTWARLTAPPAYPYRNKVEGAKSIKPPKPSFLEQLILGIIRFFGTVLGTILMWVVLLGILGYVVYRLVIKDGRFAFSRAKKIEEKGTQPDAEDLHTTNWMQLLNEASEQGNFRMAIRYGYLFLLQALEERGHIHYLPAKTNWDYATELAGTSAAQPFRNITRRYEFAWYGGYPVTTAQFEAYRAELESLQNTLGRR